MIKARGLGGGKQSVIRARRHLPVVLDHEGKEKTVNIGFVGEVASVRKELINRITDQDIIPVIAPLGRDREGQIYNINGDMMAGEVAGALEAEKLVFLTDVPGIMREGQGDEGPQLLSSLTQADIGSLLEEGVIAGGMIPKVKAGLGARKKGVKKVHIIDGRVRHSLLLEIFTDKGIGTEISK